MNRIEATRRPAAKELLVQGAPRLDANVRSPALVTDSATGEPVAYIGRFSGDLASYRRALINYPKDTTVRAGGIRNVSKTFGFASRSVLLKRNSCRACNGASSAKTQHDVISNAAAVLAAQFTDAVPWRAAIDRKLVEAEVLPEWRMPGAWWTSGVVNWSSPLPYHYDRNNFPAWSAMVVVRREVRGGHLHIPEYDLVLECRDGDVVFFNGNDLMHGVTPMSRLTPSGYRISAVYYPIAKMRFCMESEAEFRFAQTSRTGREDTLLERQREQGWAQ